MIKPQIPQKDQKNAIKRINTAQISVFEELEGEQDQDTTAIILKVKKKQSSEQVEESQESSNRKRRAHMKK